ncbi:ARP2/3 complex, 16kDa subunit (p16-Arc) [Kalmanozyma brasiliensis GHG001]|uniref:Actin-related protein 2/3 complex subunit 5 n=1 Tax=Kalmanozyma brasiliensis (strain GHG001) TaxID=1365824 RepID=V5ESG4_KALBG|nr:ARP2/3 complex, 16kDa subunit (p16-Arc) [Kalmanozyma brasiliensis GHG001]EST05898.1 ARP2/3 complex, 16kDa subunit (p16-Arc) [Kalmanozyma brasiliensis GHG001]
MDNFRKIDIDQYDEEAISPEELVESYPKAAEQATAEARAKSTEVRGLIGRSDTAGALALILSDYPYGPTVEEAKQITLHSLLEIVNSTKSSDISAAVKAISIDQRDALMKFLYKGLQLGGEGADGVNCAVLLGWHERLTEVAGTGCIVRVMSDRRTL